MNRLPPLAVLLLFAVACSESSDNPMEAVHGTAEAVDTPIGRLPARGALDTEGLDLPEADLDLLLGVDREVWREEAGLVPEFFKTFGDHLPRELWEEYEALVKRLG